jgi:hypothetical protein
MSLGRELDDILAKMRVLAHGPAARPLDAPFIKGGKSTGGAPRDFGETLHEEWEPIARKMVEAARIALLRGQGDRTYRTRGQPSKEERDKRILNFYEGSDARYVAYVEDIPEQSVRKLRRDHDLRPHDGKGKD